MHRKTMFAAVCSVSVALMAGAPAAAQSVEARQVRVSYGDLNLNSRAGAETFLTRLRAASSRACYDRSGPMTLRERQEIRKCKQDATEQAVADLGHHNVTSRFAALGGDVSPVLFAAQ